MVCSKSSGTVHSHSLNGSSVEKCINKIIQLDFLSRTAKCYLLDITVMSHHHHYRCPYESVCCVYHGSECWAGWSFQGEWSRGGRSPQTAAGRAGRCCRASARHCRSSLSRRSAVRLIVPTSPAAHAATVLRSRKRKWRESEQSKRDFLCWVK